MIRHILLAAVAASLLAGCAAAPPVDERHLAERQVRIELPFHPQTAHHCGPAALASVLAWSGEAATPAELAEAVYLPGREGSLQAELLAAARRHDRLAYRLEPSFEALLAELQAGHPVLVLQNLAFDWIPRWHYAVAVGYDLDAGVLELHSGTVRGYRVDIGTFYRTWQRADRWAVTIMPAGRIPATADEPVFLRAALDLEELGHGEAAIKAYRAALARWPESIDARLALAALHYRFGDLAAAAGLLRAVLERDPGNIPAMNNLAHILGEQGQRAAAERWALRALADPGPYRAVVEETLRTVRAQ